MLLRGSGEYTNTDHDLSIIHGAKHDDGTVPHAAILTDYADAFFDSQADLASAREAVENALGIPGLIDAAGIIGIFNAVVRIADGTGIPLEDYKKEISQDWRADLGIDDFPSAKES